MTDEEKRLTRREYREQQEREKEERTQSIPDSEPDDDLSDDGEFVDDSNDDNQLADDENLSREDQLALDHETEQAAKSNQLKHRLNLVIAGLVVAIVIVYLILFFVG